MAAHVHYKKVNKFEKYHFLVSSEKQTIDDIVSNFIQEITTTKGTNAFDRDYGTNFIESISDISNPDKVSYFFNINSSSIISKYPIEQVVVKNASFNRSTGTMNVYLVAEFKDVAMDVNFDYPYSGTFVDSELLEI